MFSLNLRG